MDHLLALWSTGTVRAQLVWTRRCRGLSESGCRLYTKKTRQRRARSRALRAQTVSIQTMHLWTSPFLTLILPIRQNPS